MKHSKKLFVIFFSVWVIFLSTTSQAGTLSADEFFTKVEALSGKPFYNEAF